jgi:hypothetical protein
MTITMFTIPIKCLFLMLVGEEDQELLFDLVHAMRAFVVVLDLDLLLL